MPNKKVTRKRRPSGEVDIDNSKQTKVWNEDLIEEEKEKKTSSGRKKKQNKKKIVQATAVIEHEPNEQSGELSPMDEGNGNGIEDNLPDLTATEQFFEDDDLVDMAVSAEEEERFANEYDSNYHGESEISDQEDDCSKIAEEENQNNVVSNTRSNRREWENSDAEIILKNRRRRKQHVSSSNNNNLEQGKEKSGQLVDLNLSDDEFDAEEMKSMKKFARFLEKTGYIQKAKESTTSEKNRGNMETSENAKKTKPQRQEGMLSLNNTTAEDQLQLPESGSETTIYRRAVPMQLSGNNDHNDQMNKQTLELSKNRYSSSSDDEVNTSDELLDINSSNGRRVCDGNVDNIEVMRKAHTKNVIKHSNDQDEILYQRFVDCKLKEQRQEVCKRQQQNFRASLPDSHPQPSTSRGVEEVRCNSMVYSPEERSRQMIRQVEENKARILEVPGKQAINSQDDGDLLHSVLVDDQYALVGAHLDDATKNKIIEVIT